jgi:hypothetical protein
MPRHREIDFRLARRICADRDPAAERVALMRSPPQGLGPKIACTTAEEATFMGEYSSETTTELLNAIRDLIKEETDRGASLNTRGVAVVGFAGVIVSVSGAVAKSILDVDISGTQRHLALVLFSLALLAVIGATLIALLGVLRVRDVESFSLQGEGGVKHWCSPEFSNQTPADMKTWLLDGWIRILEQRRGQNDGKANWLRVAFFVLAAGALFGAASSAIIGWAQQ